jgi:hypothetical protein
MEVSRALCTLVLLIALSAAAPVSAQTPPPQAAPPAQAAQAAQDQVADAGAQQVDVFDLLRLWRHKDQRGKEPPPWDYRKPMLAVAPVIGVKPSSGVIVGAAGNVAFFRGDPKTTHISSAVVSATISTKKQTALTARFTTFTRDDGWRFEGDNRGQWTSQDIFCLGTGTASADKLNAKFDFFRFYETAYRRLRPGLFAGAGLHFESHANIRPGSGASDEAWASGPYVQYTEANGYPLTHQTSSGVSVNLLVDTRDSPINADRGWYANASYRPFFKGFLGGDATWQELYLDARTYATLSRQAKRKLAFWLFGDFVTGGTAPYFDLPATAMDTYGRSGRGYGEGRFRGERMLYGEVEYRAPLMRNGLVGMVAFLNVTTITNLQTGERLFHTFAPGGGAGLRLLINKRSKTNLCFDVGFGKDGSRGVYLGVQEAY